VLKIKHPSNSPINRGEQLPTLIEAFNISLILTDKNKKPNQGDSSPYV
jgi:hypothetical protein